MLVLIKGAGDLATGVAHRLHQCGFPVVMTEIPQPTTVRCTVAFSTAVYQGQATVEGVTARRADTPAAIQAVLGRREIPVAVDPGAKLVELLAPTAVIDGVIAKRNLGTAITDAPVVIALGPGFCAGEDCHAVVETKRGHYLGSVLYTGRAIPNTGIPGVIEGVGAERVIRACGEGSWQPVVQIRQLVQAGELVATVDGQPVRAAISGVVRGLLPQGTPVHRGMKAGDIDPRGIPAYCDTISDKARAIAGGALEALLHLLRERGIV